MTNQKSDPSNDPVAEFEAEKICSIAANGGDATWKRISREWLLRAFETRYMYNFTSLGRPIIQTPVDMVAMQELIWDIKPDLIIETGIAHGGSLVMSASVLALLDYCDALESNQILDPCKPRRKVLGIDIDIRAHNRRAIEAHPMANRIEMIQGSSIDAGVIAQVHQRARDAATVLVCLDSNHTYDHVMAELKGYASLVTRDSYCVVFDTVVEDMPAGTFPNRPWDPGNNPKTAVWEFLKTNRDFEIDIQMDNKLLISVAPNGYLKRVS